MESWMVEQTLLQYLNINNIRAGIEKCQRKSPSLKSVKCMNMAMSL